MSIPDPEALVLPRLEGRRGGPAVRGGQIRGARTCAPRLVGSAVGP